MNNIQTLAVVGGRYFTDYNTVAKELAKYQFASLVSGGATGVDTIAYKYAKIHSIPIRVFYPDWQKYGKSAGPLRNKQIIQNANHVLAFWDGLSRGTRSSIQLARTHNVPLTIIRI